jgi:hypothetical protein
MSEWQPIETAPKDARVLLYRPTASEYWRVMGGSFAPDQYAKKPRPYWAADTWSVGKKAERDNPPSHWMPFPKPSTLGACREEKDVSATSLLNLVLAEDVDKLLQHPTLREDSADLERAMSKDKAAEIIHAVLWAYSSRAGSFASAYAFDALFEAIGLESWVFKRPGTPGEKE